MAVGYSHASGRGLADCVVLAHHPGGGAVLAVRPGTEAPLDVRVIGESPQGWSGLWRTDRGRPVAVGRDGRAWVGADPWGPDSGRWQTWELGFAMRGVHGRGDAIVVWGERPSDGAPVLATRTADGEWRPVPGPGFPLASVAWGADGVWAVGDGGLGRWDGEGWSVLEGVGALRAVDAAGEVVVAAADGTVSAGGAAGFRVLGQGPAEPAAVAAWQGAVWIGAAAGLWRLGSGAVKPDRAITTLDARGDLLACAGELVMATADGARFAGGLRGALRR